MAKRFVHLQQKAPVYIVFAFILCVLGILVRTHCLQYGSLVRLEEKWDYILSGEEQKTEPQETALPKPAPASLQKTSTSTPAVVILVYHKILPPSAYALSKSKNFVTTTSLFEDEMDYLHRNGYTALTMRELLIEQKEGTLPQKPVVITFDDGWKDQYTHALPILNAYNIKATFYIYTGVIGSSAFMNWQELQTLIQSHMEIGDHTTHHPNLKKVPPQQLSDELLQSKKTLEKHLGIEVVDFAYPYGLYNDSVVQALKSYGYLSARSSDKGIERDFTDPYKLKVYYAPKSMDGFISIFNGVDHS